MSNILITSAGRRVDLVNIFKDELKKINPSYKVYAIDHKPELSAACYIADNSFKSPKVSDKEYIEFIIQLCRKHDIRLVIPTIDFDLPVLSKHRKTMEDLGIEVIVSNETFIDYTSNKEFTNKLFNKIGIDTPKIYSKYNLTYPCFVKPVDGSSSKGIYVLHDESFLSQDIFENSKNIFTEFIDSTYEEYTIDIYFDRHGDLKCYVPRKRIETRAGEVSKALTTKGHLYQLLGDKLRKMRGARGCVTLQVFFNESEKILKAIEVNARFGGGYPLTYEAGGNFPEMILKQYLLGKDIDLFENWEEDLLMLRYDSKLIVHAKSK